MIDAAEPDVYPRIRHGLADLKVTLSDQTKALVSASVRIDPRP
jgi:hypothetical protein